MTLSTLQSRIDRITDILRRDDGISGAMHYTEQISWILFLKYLHDLEDEKEAEAKLNGTKYTRVIDKEFRWDVWASPQTKDGQRDYKNELTGDDLIRFVNGKLFPYLQGFKSNTQEVKSIKYKIGAVFEFMSNRIASGHTLREVIDNISDLNFQSSDDLFELSVIYEGLLRGMGSDGGNSGEFYTPRAVIKAMVEVLNPQVGDTCYDGAVGSAGFLIQAYDYLMRDKKKYSTAQLRKIKEDTFFGYEKTPLAYVMGMMNMILHGIESPNIYKQNTLTADIRNIQEKDRHSVILANPPFGGKEKSQIQQNFPIQSNSTELLFLQHFMKMLRKEGRAGIVIPEGVLFQSNQAFKAVKKELLENFNLHTIVSLPAGVFLPYSGVKTNIIFFERKGATTDVWYYEVNPPYKLTKNKPIAYEHLEEFVKLYPKRSNTPNSWMVNVNDIVERNYDLSARNPNKEQEEERLTPTNLLREINKNDAHINSLINDIELIIKRGHSA